jgi:hypothetical protein
MNLYYVQPRGTQYRVVDYEGYVIGPPFTHRDSAQIYANALNKARARRAPTMLPAPIPVLPEKVVDRLSLRVKLRALADKLFHRRLVRLGL